MEFDDKSCLSVLQELRPQIGNYKEIWRILRLLSRVKGYVPPRAMKALKPFFNPAKPYFVGATSEGILFLGDYRDKYSIDSMVQPDYDKLLVQFLKDRMQSCQGNYVDIGTNMGVTAATMAAYLKGRAEVMAFEPVAETARRAAATFALNKLDNVRLFQIAVGDVEGETTFYSSVEDSDSATIHPTQENIEWTMIRVPCRTLDNLWSDKRITDVGMIKIDVEGHEPQTICGGHQLFQEVGPDLLYEYHAEIAHKVGWSPTDITNIMRQWRPYEFKLLAENGSLSDLNINSIHKIANIYGALPESHR